MIMIMMMPTQHTPTGVQVVRIYDDEDDVHDYDHHENDDGDD